ncbi:MAG: DeoR/GlpR family DNA-binding transcription regulator [Anaerolineales bacterium]
METVPIPSSVSLIPAQRHELLLKVLASQRIASCAALAEALNVSESTIRRDLEILEKQGLVERTRGGAILNERIRYEAEFVQRAQRMIEEKRLIGRAAATMIEPGDVVFVNSGTTTEQVLRQIRGVPNVTVFTNNTSLLNDGFEVDYELVVLGGSYLPLSKAVVGPLTSSNLSQVYATKTFIGIEGISLRYGCTVSTFPEAEIIRLMIEHTQGPVIIVTDHTKWGAVSNHLIARLEQVDKVITDSGLDASARMALISRSIDVIVAT